MMAIAKSICIKPDRLYAKTPIAHPIKRTIAIK